MIYTVTLNPALDKTVEIGNFAIDTVNRVSAMRTDPGGKGINVSKVIAALGGQSIALGILGGKSGRAISAELDRMGIKADFLFTGSETRTNLKIVDKIGHTNTDINEPGAAVPNAVLEELLKSLTGRIKKDDIVVLAGSLPQGAAQDTYIKYITACRGAGAKVFFDADGEILAEGITALPYLIKPNRDELERLLGRRLDSLEKVKSAAKELLSRGIKRVVVSLGAEGALFADSEQIIYTEGLQVPVISTVGAGDSMVAALALAEERGLKPEDAARLSTAVSAANVMCEGTNPAEYSQVAELLNRVKIYNL